MNDAWTRVIARKADPDAQVPWQLQQDIDVDNGDESNLDDEDDDSYV